ncbi:MAG: cation transporter [Clostridia bacterium]|nr:cation transporter [Clostridia bacterium]
MKEKSAVSGGVTRERVIIRTSLIGIAANIFLVAIKGLAGLMSGSIAIILDAVNNLSDAISSTVTMIGAKIAARRPDKKHPLGHGRVEYISAMIVSAIVVYAGVTSLVESVKKIISPAGADYSALTLAIISTAVVVKIILGLYVRGVGRKVNSASLVASGVDALSDAVISVSVLLSAVIYLAWGVSLEAYVGVVISLFIIKAGVGILKETLDEILGKRVDRELVTKVKEAVCEDEEVHGAYDLVLHNYGPDIYVGSVHVEIADTMSADEIDRMERRIAENVYGKTGVILSGIGIYSMNTWDDDIRAIRSNVIHIANSHDGILQIHGFYADLEKKTISFDVILDFELEDRDKTFGAIKNEVAAAYPDFDIKMTMDVDI